MIRRISHIDLSKIWLSCLTHTWHVVVCRVFAEHITLGPQSVSFCVISELRLFVIAHIKYCCGVTLRSLFILVAEESDLTASKLIICLGQYVTLLFNATNPNWTFPAWIFQLRGLLPERRYHPTIICRASESLCCTAAVHTCVWGHYWGLMKDWFMLLSWCVEFIDLYANGSGFTGPITIVDMYLHSLFKCYGLHEQIFDKSLIQRTPPV